MAPSRRRKLKETAEAGRRRSARLMALEVQHNSKARDILEPHAEQGSDLRQANLHKRGRKKKVKEVYEDGQLPKVGTSNNGNLLNSRISAMNTPLERIIAYILDILQIKDEHESLTMPDNLEAYDYGERVSSPGDFATLRQKHKDGMYKNFEQFESDVFMVFHKAMSGNIPGSVPYKLAEFLQDEAKHIFRVVKLNPMYAELQLSRLHQQCFSYNTRAARNDNKIGTPADFVQPESSLCPRKPANMQGGNSVMNAEKTNGRLRTSVQSSGRRNSRSKARTIPKSTEDQDAPFKFGEELRRYTYMPESNSVEQVVKMVYDKPEHLIYNKNTWSYKESLMNFVKDAGPVAKKIAEQKCLEFDQIVHARSLFAQYRSFVVPSNKPQFTNPFGNWTSHRNLSTDFTTLRPQVPSRFPPIHSYMPANQRYASNLGHAASTARQETITANAAHMVDPGTIGAPGCRLQTDVLLALPIQTGAPTMASSSSRAADNGNGYSSRGVLPGGQVLTIFARDAGFTSATSAWHQRGQCSQCKQPQSHPSANFSFRRQSQSFSNQGPFN